MLLLLSSLLRIASTKQCDVPRVDGDVLSLFYKPDHSYYMKTEPVMSSITDKLENRNINLPIIYTDCSKCDCGMEGILAEPTLVLYTDGKEVGRYTGFGSYSDYAEFISNRAKIDREIFNGRIKTVSGEVTNLTRKDFEYGFVGPWIVLFYNKEVEEIDSLIKYISKEYSGRLNVGKISESEAGDLPGKLNIATYPLIMGIYDGVMVPFTRPPNELSLTEFINELIEPSFQSIDYRAFQYMAKGSNASGSPIFIVMYSDLSLANSYFNQIAHDYKFRAKVFKTDDPRIFKSANIWPKSPDSEYGHSVTDEDMVILTVYKHGVFHRCPYKLFDMGKISVWIFNSHFPNITRITNDSFYAVFHGIKPVVLLITDGDEHVEKLEGISYNYHNGMPFVSYVFASIDVNEYPMFIPALVPGIKHPAVMIFDPGKQMFYTIRGRENLGHNSLVNAVNMLIKAYEDGSAVVYPYAKSSLKWYVIGAFAFITILVAGWSYYNGGKGLAV